MSRRVLASFVFTFAFLRCAVYLIMTHRLPDWYVYVGGTHLHHLNLGIFLLAALSGVMLFRPPSVKARPGFAIAYGVGLALTFDEFGMWLHLGGGYWQRASLDAVGIIAALLALIWVSPRITELRPHHWWVTGLLAVLVSAFGILLVDSYRYISSRVESKLQSIEGWSPP